MAWPSDGLNDSEYWKYLPNNYELIISRYNVSGSLNPVTLKKEANLNKISKSLKFLNIKKLDILILCDFAASILNKDYHKHSELYFQEIFNLPCLNIVSSTLKFLKNRKENISIISPYNNTITKNFINLNSNKKIITSVSNLSLKSEEEIEDVKYIVKDLKLNRYKNDILFIGGGITISSFAKYYKNKYGFNIYSSPLILIKDTINLIK